MSSRILQRCSYKSSVLTVGTFVCYQIRCKGTTFLRNMQINLYILDIILRRIKKLHSNSSICLHFHYIRQLFHIPLQFRTEQKMHIRAGHGPVMRSRPCTGIDSLADAQIQRYLRDDLPPQTDIRPAA